MSAILSATNVHFTGIKGVGMTAAAVCMKDLGASVSGSDVQDVFDTDKVLAEKNIPVSSGFMPENIDPQVDLLIHTGAHGGVNNPQVLYAKQKGIRAISHAQAVGELMEGKEGISVCGVGGKTTTSAMIATVLEHAGKNPSYLVGVASIGGVKYPGKYSLGSHHFVAEADEYATSPGVDNTPRFMSQSPAFIICTNIIHDHPDIYKQESDVIEAFKAFFNKLPKDGLLVLNSDDQNSVDVSENIDVQKIYVGTKNNSDYKIVDTKAVDGQQHIAVDHKGSTFELVINLPGVFNAKNALMAYAVLKHNGLEEGVIREGLLQFTGTNRRFQQIARSNGVLYYDDYAHHPEEIKVTLKAAKDWFSGKNIFVVFQPHTYSRTKVLLEDFAGSFTDAHQVVITDIFPSAREVPDPTISAQILSEKISQTHPQTSYVSGENLVEYLKRNLKKDDVLFTLGAGDVYKIHQELN